MPELNFKGKEFVYNHHLTVPFRPLEIHPDKSIGEPSLDGNLIIHGDNLHALKALLPMYAGKVDCIFIDPPYNTGNEGWAYNDNVNSPMIREWLDSNPIGVEDGLRHDKWACMMWPRLKLLHDLLSENGFIFICIDDIEEALIRQICFEIFGRNGFVTSFIWKSRVSEDTRAKNGVSNDHEYVLCFSKSEDPRLKGGEKDQSKFSNPDGDSRGAWRSADLTGLATKAQRPNLHYDLIDPDTGINYGCPPKGWRYDPTTMAKKIEEKRVLWPVDTEGRPRHKLFSEEMKSKFKGASSMLQGFSTASGTKEVNEILGSGSFDFPKPRPLVEFFIEQIANEDALILDSFAGSGTTAHAVLAANARDGGNRRFILVEGEDYADKLTAERVRRAINGYAFTGTQREELLRESITLAKLKNANALLEKVQKIETLDGPKFDRIRSTVRDGALIVTGERDCEETALGLGGTFTYCTLGDPIDMDGLLTGEDLPEVQQLAALLYHTATSQAFASADLVSAPEIGEHVYRLGHANGRHLWLFYNPDLGWLKSAAAALTLSNARAIAATAEGEHLVFAPAKFVSRDLLAAQRIPVEYAPLPYSLYRVETA